MFTALVAMGNALLSDGPGEWFGLNAVVQAKSGGQFAAFDLRFLFAMIGAPFAWLIGVDANHLPPWFGGAPDYRTGDGVEGGTFESWFMLD